MMNLKMLKLSLAVAGILAGDAALGSPVTFAEFTVSSQDNNLNFKNVASDDTSSKSAHFYTISDPFGVTPGSSLVNFSFLQAALQSYVSNVSAVFTLNGFVDDTAAEASEGNLSQSGLAGSFSFISTSDITVNHTVHAAGANLLSGSFSSANLFGPRLGDTANLASGYAATAYTSDFLTFAAAVNHDLFLSLIGIGAPFQATPQDGAPTNALRSFRAVTTGNFSSDAAPQIDAVPEPQTWMLAIAGFALVGFQLRRKRSTTVRFAA
jgi:hypothetical protein